MDPHLKRQTQIFCISSNILQKRKKEKEKGIEIKLI